MTAAPDPDLLRQCYLSGQISEAQWQEHLRLGHVALSEPESDPRNQKRFMAVPARRLTTYDRALQSARNMAEHNGMTVRVMEVRETIYAVPKRKAGTNG
ncbi:hypothetical protein [Labrys neptuniae]